jgi:DNA repair exonuclease SbcCD nuclease subunit
MRSGYIDNIKIIGDAHLGRRFVNGVPLDRRGEREHSLKIQFYDELVQLKPGTDCVVQLGDIFDRYLVTNEVLDDTYRSIRTASRTNPSVDYYFMRGNHDAQRDMEKVSSFDILVELCIGLDNVHFVVDKPIVGRDRIGLIPWHPIKTAEEMAQELTAMAGLFPVVFGHWDLQSYGGDEHNVIPLATLSVETKLVITGHDHKPREFAAGDTRVLVWGSMQPLAHGEEPEDAVDPMYVTLTTEELAQRTDLHGKCVRILLQPGEVLPTDIDCLQLTAKRIGVEEEQNLDVDLDGFDMNVLFDQAFSDVDPGITDEVRAKFKELRT